VHILILILLFIKWTINKEDLKEVTKGTLICHSLC
jgi:hypothetical protein